VFARFLLRVLLAVKAAEFEIEDVMSVLNAISAPLDAPVILKSPVEPLTLAGSSGGSKFISLPWVSIFWLYISGFSKTYL